MVILITIKKVINIIKAAKTAELATFQSDGYPEIRALLNLANEKNYKSLKEKAIVADGETLTIYFTTNTSSRKMHQIRKNNKVCVYFCIPEKFDGVSAIGTMEEVTDPAMKEDFWQKDWTMYYHEGPSDPDYTLLKFTTKHLHCWSGLGLHDFGEKISEE